jgi:hypothetical protein
MNINEKLDELFLRWKEKSEQTEQNRESSSFCEDGLMYKYGHEKNYVDKLWVKSQKRIMFFLKDAKEQSGDSRLWLYEEGTDHRNNRNLKPKLMKVLAYWLYGFTTVKEGKIEELEAISHEQLVECFNQVPFAFVESKKQSGKPSISKTVLTEYIDRYKDFLIEQIDILNPNIIVCCGEPQYKFVLNKIYIGSEQIDKNLFYNKAKQTLIFYSYHPSYYRREWKKPETFYKDLMSKYKLFLSMHPDLN